MLEAARDELVATSECLLDAGGDRARALRVDTDGGVPARLVERRVLGHDARRPRSHRLDHRNTEALEARGIDERARAAVEAGQAVLVEMGGVAGCNQRRLVAEH